MSTSARRKAVGREHIEWAIRWKKARPIEARRELVAHLESDRSPDKSTWRVGTEHEKFAFYRKDNSPSSL